MYIYKYLNHEQYVKSWLNGEIRFRDASVYRDILDARQDCYENKITYSRSQALGNISINGRVLSDFPDLESAPVVEMDIPSESYFISCFSLKIHNDLSSKFKCNYAIEMQADSMLKWFAKKFKDSFLHGKVNYRPFNDPNCIDAPHMLKKNIKYQDEEEYRLCIKKSFLLNGGMQSNCTIATVTVPIQYLNVLHVNLGII